MKICECCELQEGYVNPSQKESNYFDGNINWLRASDLNNLFVYSTERTLSQMGFDSAGASAKLFRPDTLAISKSGTIGRLGILKDFMCGNRAVINIAPDNKVDLMYLYYWMLRYNKKIVRKATGSIQKNLYVSLLGSFDIGDLSIDEQKKIAEKINPLTEKIDVNNKLISYLEEYSQLLFHKWFVDFNFPDEIGLPYKDNGGKMVEVDGKLIPKGWRWVNLPKAAAVVDCLHSKKPENNGYKQENCLLQLENISTNGLLDLSMKFLVSDDDYKEWTSRIEVTTGDLVITNAGRVGAIAQIPEGFKFGIGRNMTAIRPKKVLPTWFYLYFKSSIVKSQIKRNKDKGSFFESLNVRGIKVLEVLLPNTNTMNEFEKITRPIRRKMEVLNMENQLLEETRNLLIKELIN